MGFFGNLVNDAKERALRDAKAILEVIAEEDDIRYVTERVHKELSRHLSIVAQAKIMQTYQRRLTLEKNTDALYGAFQDMYRKGKHWVDTLALNMSQWIGKVLYDRGDYRVRQEEMGEKSLFVPLYDY